MRKKIEDLTRNKNSILTRVKNFELTETGEKEPLEILIFKGFSNCTTHATSSDVNKTKIPKNATILEGELLKAPMNPCKEEVLHDPIEITMLINPIYWT